MNIIVGTAMLLTAIGILVVITIQTAGWRDAAKGWAFSLALTALVVGGAFFIARGFHP